VIETGIASLKGTGLGSDYSKAKAMVSASLMVKGSEIASLKGTNWD
jgi:hypothetical protein